MTLLSEWRLRALSLLLALALSPACATTQALAPRAAAADRALAQAVKGAQSEVIALHAMGEMTEGDYVAWQRGFDRVATIGLALGSAIRAGNAESVRAACDELLKVFDELLRGDVLRVKPERQQQLREWFGLAKTSLLVLSALL